MNSSVKKWAAFCVRWGIAVAGIAWVLENTSFRDRVMILDPRTHRPVEVRVLGDAKDSDSSFQILDWHETGGKPRIVSRDEIWTRPDQSAISLNGPGVGARTVRLLAVHPPQAAGRGQPPTLLCVEDRHSHEVSLIAPSEVEGGYQVSVPYPRVDIGLIRLVRSARPLYLLLALLVIPLTYLLTTWRWHMLLGAMEIYIGLWRTFVLNMVGAFYNTFMPGSTGGDLIKAYYASKHTPHRVRAILSVIVDRVLGLLALVILGAVMACFQLQVPECRRIAFLSVLALIATATGLFVFYHPRLRRITGLEFILNKLPMQRHVTHAVEAMHLYGQKPGIAAGATVMTFPVHITVIISSYFAGQAFGLTLPFWYYWVITPVIALVGAIPIAPQGAGVMEFFAIELTRRQGVTISQAFALAMSIRVVAMFWNLVAGIFVLRGGYHAPDAEEQETMESDDGAEEPSGRAAADSERLFQGRGDGEAGNIAASPRLRVPASVLPPSPPH
jgi:uncharacterized protein (TIRG00374 family)